MHDFRYILLLTNPSDSMSWLFSCSCPQVEHLLAVSLVSRIAIHFVSPEISSICVFWLLDLRPGQAPHQLCLLLFPVSEELLVSNVHSGEFLLLTRRHTGQLAVHLRFKNNLDLREDVSTSTADSASPLDLRPAPDPPSPSISSIH